MSIYICVCVYVCIDIYIYIYTIYIYIYIYIGRKSLAEHVWLNTTVCFFFKNLQVKNIQVFSLVFLLLGQVGKEKTLH